MAGRMLVDESLSQSWAIVKTLLWKLFVPPYFLQQTKYSNHQTTVLFLLTSLEERKEGRRGDFGYIDLEELKAFH